MSREEFFSKVNNSFNYYELYLDVQSSLSREIKSMNNDQLGEERVTERIKNMLTKFPHEDTSMLSKRLYHDIVGNSFISFYKLFEEEGFEELNINAWNDVDIMINGQMYKTKYSFLNVEHSIIKIRKLLSETKKTIDDSTPIVETDLGKGMRITAIKSPIIDENRGICVSIRKVTATTQTISDVLNSGSITEDMLRLLIEASKSGVSICFAGETGSGKTFLAGAILRELAKTQRTFTIEENSREWDLSEIDKDNRYKNSVIHTKTRHDNSLERDISQNKLLETALRFDPKVIGVGEMRSDEAYSACEAAGTGHTVITTTHANSAEETPERIVSLMKKAHDFSDLTLMRLAVKAFPLLVFLGKLPDGTRRVKEIAEATGVNSDTGEAIISKLYEFEIEDNIYTETKNEEYGAVTKVKTIGSFKQINGISEKLKQRMLDGGATKSIVESFTMEVK